MDDKSPEKRTKPKKRSSKAPALAAGLLVTAAAAGGGAYYLGYLPQTAIELPFVIPFELPFEIPWLEPAVIKKPSPAPATAKPRAPVKPPAATAGAATPGPQPGVVQAPAQPAPIAEKQESQAAGESKAIESKTAGNKTIKGKAMESTVVAKAETAIQQPKPVKRKVAIKAKSVKKSSQAAAVEKKPVLPAVEQKTNAEFKDVLLEPGPPVEEYVITPAPAAYASETVEPLPSPVSVRPEPVAPAAPPLVPRVVIPKYNDLMTPVMRGDRKAVKQLLDLGWWVDKPNDSGITPLTAAVMNGDTRMAQLLLDHGAMLSGEAIKIARKNKDEDMILLLERRGARK